MTNDAPLARREPGALAPAGLTLDQLAAAWLDSKFRKSNSERTRRAYADTLADFRALLQSGGADLDSDPNDIAFAAQGWAGRKDRNGHDPKGATYNHRLAVLSSFYTYAVKRGQLQVDPIQRIDRAKVKPYKGAQALNPESVEKILTAIDRSTIEGLRDYTLLLFSLKTGKRVSEVAALRWKDLQIHGDRITVTFRRTKGGDLERRSLKKPLSKTLMTWLHTYYGPQLGDLAADAPLWPSLRSTRAGVAGEPLSIRGVQAVVERRLGTHAHVLRHTFAAAMKQKGASVMEIQHMLGHASITTTTIYLPTIATDENPFEDELFSGLD